MAYMICMMSSLVCLNGYVGTRGVSCGLLISICYLAICENE